MNAIHLLRYHAEGGPTAVTALEAVELVSTSRPLFETLAIPLRLPRPDLEMIHFWSISEGTETRKSHEVHGKTESRLGRGA